MIEKSPRTSVHIPRDSKTNEFLDKMSKRFPNSAKWEFLEEAVKKMPKSKEEQDVDTFNECADKLAGSNLELRKKFTILAKYIFQQLLGMEIVDVGGNQNLEWRRTGRKQLDDSYFEDLKKL